VIRCRFIFIEIVQQSFHYVVTGYCRDRIGQSYIERGSYQIVQPDNDEVIDRSAFSQTVKEGQTFEMSIILRSKNAIEDDKRCPRCSHLNTHALFGSWTRCLRCSGRFHVKEVSYLEWSNIQDEYDNDNDKEGERQEDITHGTSNELSKRQVSDPQNDLEAKYFRRITLEILYAGARISANTTFTPGRGFGVLGATACTVSLWIKMLGMALDVTYGMKKMKKRALFSKLAACNNHWALVNAAMARLTQFDLVIEFFQQELESIKQAGADRACQACQASNLNTLMEYNHDGRIYLAQKICVGLLFSFGRLEHHPAHLKQHQMIRCAHQREQVDRPEKERAENAVNDEGDVTPRA